MNKWLMDLCELINWCWAFIACLLSPLPSLHRECQVLVVSSTSSWYLGTLKVFFLHCKSFVTSVKSLLQALSVDHELHFRPLPPCYTSVHCASSSSTTEPLSQASGVDQEFHLQPPPPLVPRYASSSLSSFSSPTSSSSSFPFYSSDQHQTKMGW